MALQERLDMLAESLASHTTVAGVGGTAGVMGAMRGLQAD